MQKPASAAATDTHPARRQWQRKKADNVCAERDAAACTPAAVQCMMLRHTPALLPTLSQQHTSTTHTLHHPQHSADHHFVRPSGMLSSTAGLSALPPYGTSQMK
jgi:hypothetical protein